MSKVFIFDVDGTLTPSRGTIDSEFKAFFMNFCKKNNWELDKTKTGNLIKQLDVFIDEVRLEIKKQHPRLIQIKAMKKVDASVSTVKYQEENFYVYQRENLKCVKDKCKGVIKKKVISNRSSFFCSFCQK